jgi:sugar phosphate isomerase/epimerase
MKIGAMNNPMKNLLREIQWIGEYKFDFVDLTLEPPEALATDVDIDEIRKLLDKYKMDAIGHTAYYLPIASAFPSFIDLAMKELRSCFEVFQALDIQKVNLHPDESVMGIFNRNRAVNRNIKSIKQINEDAKRYGLKLIIENSPRLFNSEDELEQLFNAVEDVGLHLDVGHANLNTEKNKTPDLLAKFQDKLEHVHMSDNRSGTADLHLPLGAGLIPWEKMVKSLKESGYNDTITLEVFSRDKRYLLASREKLLELWNQS